MKRFILLVLIAAAVLLAFLMPYVSFEKEKPILEKGETYKAADLIAKAGGEVTPQQEYLKTDEVGRFEFTYTVKRLFFSKDVILQYEVVDTTPPELRIKETGLMPHLPLAVWRCPHVHKRVPRRHIHVAKSSSQRATQSAHLAPPER